MYKITVGENTMVGCNHDAWLTTPRVWFENAKHKNEFGSVFTGSREGAPNKTTPQSGMNTMGLVFSRLESFYPEKHIQFKNKKRITNEADYLSEILHTCATIKEVKKFIEQYDQSFFINDVFIYIDRFGDYLVVEPYQLIEGNNPNYVLANFCPSITENKQARNLDRYRKGEDFLKSHKAIATLDYCTSLSDTMSVCRSRNGDGTLITSIFDTKEKTVSLYFYHNFDTVVQFNLFNELFKGDHMLNLPDIFPKNAEFDRLVNFKTPSNSIVLIALLVLAAALFVLISLILSGLRIRQNKAAALSSKAILMISLLNSILVAYIVILITNKSIFYFDVPYKHYSSSLISAFSYTPFLLLVSFIPMLIYTRIALKSNRVKFWIKSILVANSMLYSIFILGFGYWGLFNFWN